MSKFNLSEWNAKIYNDENGHPIKTGNLGAEEFWDEFRIKSGPKFDDVCWSHIPAKWANDVREMLNKAQSELGEKIEFGQIKEKFCNLVVYFTATDENAGNRMRTLIKECQEKLRNKGLHP